MRIEVVCMSRPDRRLGRFRFAFKNADVQKRLYARSIKHCDRDAKQWRISQRKWEMWDDVKRWIFFMGKWRAYNSPYYKPLQTEKPSRVDREGSKLWVMKPDDVWSPQQWWNDETCRPGIKIARCGKCFVSFCKHACTHTHTHIQIHLSCFQFPLHLSHIL